MNEREMIQRKRLAVAALSIGGAAVLLAVPAVRAFGPYEGHDLASERIAPHGAMSMEAQQSMLDELLPDRDVTQPPPNVDPRIWAAIVPEDNQMTPERVALGRKLYFDTRLSADNTVSCATCHDVSRGFTDQRETSEGIGGAMGKRNAPTTLNAFFYEVQFLDGRVDSLEDQAALPPVNPVEGGHQNEQAVVDAIEDDAQYVRMFQAAYGNPPNIDDATRAIAAFERTLVFLDSPFDRYLAGDRSAISAKARRGWVLYNGKGRCNSCHELNPSNPLGTDNDFHNIGVAARVENFETLAAQALEALRRTGGGAQAIDEMALETDMSELGRFLVTKDRADIGAFKTQGVRNIGITAPYMHDGSMRTLWDVIDHYNKGGEANPFLDGGIEPLALTEDEIDALVEFLFTLTDVRFAEQNQRELEAQREIARTNRPFRETDVAQGRVLPFEQRVADGRVGAPPAEQE